MFFFVATRVAGIPISLRYYCFFLRCVTLVEPVNRDRGLVPRLVDCSSCRAKNLVYGSVGLDVMNAVLRGRSHDVSVLSVCLSLVHGG